MWAVGLLSLATLFQASPPACIMVETSSILEFEPGSAALTRRSRSYLDAWAETASRSRYPSRFTLIGQADRVGSREANRRLAWRRANAVRIYLTRRGVPRSRIDVRATGEDQTLIETDDEVPEPQNRVVQLFWMADPREPGAFDPSCRQPRG